MLSYLFLLIVILHGLIHLIGFINIYGITSTNQFSRKTLLPITTRTSKSVGVLWLVAAILFVIAGFMYVKHIASWWMLALPALILSQVLITIFWHDAKAGTIANIFIAVAILLALQA